MKSCQGKPQKTIFQTLIDNMNGNSHAPVWTGGTLKVTHSIFLAHILSISMQQDDVTNKFQ